MYEVSSSPSSSVVVIALYELDTNVLSAADTFVNYPLFNLTYL